MFFITHQTPSAFLQATRNRLDAHQRKLNVILPHAEKLATAQRAGHSLAPGQFWITGWSSGNGSNGELEFVLSCTEHHLGTYPLFLVYLRPLPTIPTQTLDADMFELAKRLANIVPPTRVFSFYGQEAPIRALATHWSSVTGSKPVATPYYEASSSYCTQQTLVKGSTLQLPNGHEMRLARAEDASAIAQLCKEFADDSPPFTLTPARAMQEAQYMIKNRSVSVYTIDGIVTTIVAVTRVSASVAGMTKVYTTPIYRGRGCAEKLVAHVCRSQLASGMESVVLFVGHTLAAARVYHRVGFVGVGPAKSSSYTPDAENWLEIGFHGTTLGHW
ncbi:hypothetical protein M408DRAFT_63256 [Serendipita vermifera MAFF 305830]|uniref:N-acetyltransferase domain-containing protein n=1 Tax=Serendipita vermifera MAFF 305830 TaxID=933852 RepID=A0A0C2XTU7_SERVB|nr:hypothetical protein M408DRAFT_63256 [Serendipita vermifera MAFF 305830]